MWQKWFTCLVPLMMLGVASAKPNIVIFVVDDLGISDLGCFGNDTIKTPNIDRLAEQGARLRHDVTPDAICTPNRAALLTGRYPIRSGLASDEGQDRVFLHTAASGGLPQNETTFAEIASAAGYKTGIVGKWHLGLHKSSKTDFHFHPLKQGFDFFYGLPLTNLRTCEPGQYLINIVYPALKPFNVLASGVAIGVTLYILYLAGVLNKIAFLSLLILVILITSAQAGWLSILSRLTCIVLKNYELVEQPVLLENLTARFIDEAVDFIHKNKDSPFLLYMSFAKVHTALFTTKPFVNHSVHGRYGDNVEEMDWGVGQVMTAVEELGLRENTFVYFTSDNGPYIEEISDAGEYHGGWSGIYRGGKGQCWDGGVRMPTIASWPGHIPAGISIDQLTSSMDLFPTVAKLTGGDLPQDRVIDGKDLLPLMTNKTQESSHEFVFHYCGNLVHAVRYHPKNSVTVWKAHFMTAKWTEGTESCRGRGICWCHGDFVKVHDPPLLFDVTDDPAESSPIAPNSPEYKEAMKYIPPALTQHKDSIESVPEQLVWSKNRVHPSLQMCCNFPYCTFLVDDMGIGDVGCFDNDTIKTPNIDRLAEQGARLRYDVTPDSICTPNRAAFLTGRYPIRSGLAASKGQMRVFIYSSASGGLPPNETTFAEIASAAGYRTGMIGKWHLGLHSSSNSDFHFHPLKQGFHYFYGLPLSNNNFCLFGGKHPKSFSHQGLTPTKIVIAASVVAISLFIGYLTGWLSKRTCVLLLTTIVLFSLSISRYDTMIPRFNCFVMKNYKVVEQPVILENLTARFTDEAVNFIRANQGSPFLLYMSFAKVHTPLFSTPAFVNHSVHGRYGDNVEEMDWGVGQIMAAVEELGLKENTFVYFTSDNGPHLEEISNTGEYHGGWSGIFKGGKGQCWDGGVRMPTIASWPGHIPAGISIDQLTSSMDLFPTIAKLTGGDLPQDRVIDGKGLFSLLTNQTQTSSHDFVFHYCGKQVHAVRYHPKDSDTVWKAHFVTPKWTEGTESCIGKRIVCGCFGDHVKVQDPPLLFDVSNDPSESSPVASDRPDHQWVMREIHPALQAHKRSISDVPSQLGAKNSFHPSLQMCCSFPFCSCEETGRRLEHYPK